MGGLIQRALQFEAASQIPIDIGPIDCEEFAALLIIRETRNKRQAEQSKQEP